MIRDRRRKRWILLLVLLGFFLWGLPANAKPPEPTLRLPPTLDITPTTNPSLWLDPCPTIAFDREDVPQVRHCQGYVVSRPFVIQARYVADVLAVHWEHEARRQLALRRAAMADAETERKNRKRVQLKGTLRAAEMGILLGMGGAALVLGGYGLGRLHADWPF